MRRNFYLSVNEAQAEKKRLYDDGYGPGIYEVSASVGGNVILKLFVPEEQVQSAIDYALTLRGFLAPGIDMARAKWEALTEEEREALEA